eukprot:921552-Prorocentrum_lima.AAC.1
MEVLRRVGSARPLNGKSKHDELKQDFSKELEFECNYPYARSGRSCPSRPTAFFARQDKC